MPGSGQGGACNSLRPARLAWPLARRPCGLRPGSVSGSPGTAEHVLDLAAGVPLAPVYPGLYGGPHEQFAVVQPGTARRDLVTETVRGPHEPASAVTRLTSRD